MTAPAAGWPGRLLALLLVSAPPQLAPAADIHSRADIQFIPTPAAVVDAMLGIAAVGSRDFVVDLGAGDGRILIAAAKKHGARGFGVEIDGRLVSAARRSAEREGIADRVQFVEENLFITELGRATVLTLYLSSSLLLQLRPRIFEELKPGARVVSHDFDMGGWRPDARTTVPVPDKPYGPPSSEVYLWVVPANAAGTWKWRLAEGAGAADYEVELDQTFQVLEGRPNVGGRPGRLEEGRMRGDAIRFILTADTGGRTLRQEYTGHVDGDSIRGEVRAEGGRLDWTASRAGRGSIRIGNGR